MSVDFKSHYLTGYFEHLCLKRLADRCFCFVAYVYASTIAALSVELFGKAKQLPMYVLASPLMRTIITPFLHEGIVQRSIGVRLQEGCYRYPLKSGILQPGRSSRLTESHYHYPSNRVLQRSDK